MSAQKIVNKFRKFGLPVDGVAILRNDILTVGDRTIDVHSCNYGYIRTSGRKRYSKGQQITGCDFLNNVTEDLFLVLIIDEGKNLDAYINAARQILDADSDVSILEIDVNKEAIQRSESIPPSLNKIAKISFQYTYQEVGKCDEGVCEYVADVECDVEPCDSKSFCERVQECLPEPVETECTLEVGGGCCDYSVELPPAEVSYCLTVPDITPDNSSINIDIQVPFIGYPPIRVTYNGGGITTAESIINDIISSIEGFLEYTVNGNTICISGETILNPEYNFNFQISDSEEDVCGLFTFSSNDFISQGIDCNGVSSVETLSLYTFQVLINDVWTDVTDEVSNGTWSRTNVCDDVITEWRIIDSEENVIDSGDVTAICEESAQVTDSVCNWLQAHQTAIEQLQEGGGGLTCETLTDCEVIQTLIQDVEAAQDDADAANNAIANLATVASTGSYNDLSNQPSIPAAQIQSDWNQANNAALDFIKNKPTIPTAVSQLTNDSNFITLAQSRAGGYTKFFADFGTTSVNTNTSNNVIGSVLIPANTITGNAILEVESAISRATGGANPLHRIFINTVNSYTGANQIAGISTSTTALWSKGERSFKASTGVIRGYSSTNYQGIDDLSNANAPTSTSVDWTVDQYILTVVNNATGETTTHEYTTVKVLTT